MSLPSVTQLAVLAEGGGHAGHENINPVLNGVLTFAFLLLLLFLTTRLNRDR
jgi:hypothetical protein